MAGDVTVAEAIKQLRAQLAEAQREGAGKDLRFAVKTVEVELAVVLKSEVEGGAVTGADSRAVRLAWPGGRGLAAVGR